MKTLYLVRHAKSSWDHANLSDHDRPLNHRGERDAPRMGKRLRKREDRPEVIISSSAVRAQTTAAILATAIDYPTTDISIDARLYGAEPKDVISIIGDLDDGIHCAMLIGHNPTFTALVNALGRCDLDNMPTCGVAVLTFPIDSWKKIATVRGKLVDFDFPKHEAE
jgi:phosphohistidine phosphatase